MGRISGQQRETHTKIFCKGAPNNILLSGNFILFHCIVFVLTKRTVKSVCKHTEVRMDLYLCNGAPLSDRMVPLSHRPKCHGKRKVK